jgi:sporulation protein YlmC with PRC-barrel domain
VEPLVPKRLKRARENALRHFRYPTPLTFVHGVEGEAPAEPRHQLIRLISHRAAIAVCRRICAGKYDRKIGKVTDLVFRLAEPYPDAAGLYVEHGGGQPNEFIPWDKVIKIEDDAIFVNRTDGGARYPPFVDQKGWLLLNDHLMGRTILDMDGRRTEVVNDIQLFYSKGRMIIVHVDTSFNGFLRKRRLGRPTSAHLVALRPAALDRGCRRLRRRFALHHPQPDQGAARRGPGRRPRGAVGQKAAGHFLRP